MSRLFVLISFVELLFFAFHSGEANGQFYSGTKQSFGKNRPRYNQFFWTYHRSDRFDVYYYQGGEEIATYLVNFADAEIERLESIFNTTLSNRLVFILHNRLSDMRQSNIGLITGKEEHNLGGTSQIFRNKVTLYFEADYTKFEQQVTAAISELLIRNILLSGSNKSFWDPDALGSFPIWFTEGAKAYISEGWCAKNDELLYSVSRKVGLTQLNDLSDDDAVIVGQAFWLYFAQTYGLQSVSECLSLASFNDNQVKAITYFTGKSFKEILSNFEQFWVLRLAHLQVGSQLQKPLIKIQTGKRVTQLAYSPDGNSLAWVVNRKGKVKLWVKNLSTSKKKLIHSSGNKLNQLQDYSFPVFCWHPSSNAISFFVEQKGELLLHIFDIESKQFATRKFQNVSKVLSLDYSPDAAHLVISAVVGGKPDVFTYSIATNKLERVTESLSNEEFPVFLGNQLAAAYVSNEIDNEIFTSQNVGIDAKFDRTGKSIWLAKKKSSEYVYSRLFRSRFENFDRLKWLENNRFCFISDATGQSNLFLGSVDSAINRIDTAIHYSYLVKSQQLKLVSPSFHIADYCSSKNLVAVYKDFKKRNAIFTEVPAVDTIVVSKTVWRNELEKGWDKFENDQNSKFPSAVSAYAEKVLVDNSPDNDSKINVFSWLFESEKLRFVLAEHGFSLPQKNEKVDRISKIGYNLTFFPNKFVNQVDFSFLNANYQPYTGSPFFFNPGLNLNFVVGAVDLFEDYKLYGGLSLGSDFESMEYLVMFEYLGGIYKHQLAFHRQAYSLFELDVKKKIRTNEFIYISRYPFSQVSSVGGGVTFRYDNISVPAIDFQTLSAKDDQRYWTGVKVDYTFDNSNVLGFNLLEGIRIKVFAESQVGIGMGKRADIHTFGIDARGYLALWRNIILAGRFAVGTSAGQAGLVYYLGSVDGWVNFNPMVPIFDQSIPVNNQEKLMFQALATNMRGFSQNIRNGPSFSVFNTELRAPVLKMISNRNVGSKFLNSLQIVGFFDVGSAWKGVSPWHGNNIWSEGTISNGPVTVTFKTQRSPLVAGFGGGIRFQTMGYPLRFDYAWGVESGKILPPIFYFSTSIDF